MTKVHYLQNLQKQAAHFPQFFKDFSSGTRVALKVHLGEPGNQTAFFPKDLIPLIDYLKSLNLKPFFVDTPVAYHSPRDSVNGYQKAARERGWEKLAPVVISDSFKTVQAKDFSPQVCRELIEAPAVLVVSHVKGHSCAGFGGALKNLGMGGVSKKSKTDQHTLCQPKFIKDCQGCGHCVALCPGKAIRMEEGKAHFDLAECYGCSICQLECPHHCLAPQKAEFDDLLAQAASAVIKNLPPATFYLNFIQNITRGCDCESHSGPIIAPDLGLLFSQNPVAIDQASIDLIRKATGQKIFLETTHKDPLRHVNFAAQHLKLSVDYQLLSL